MKDVGWHVGMGQKQNPYLLIPLLAKYHVGDCGIDAGIGVLTWEGRYGRQVDLLDWTDDQLGYPISIWEMAKTWEAKNRSRGLLIHG